MNDLPSEFDVVVVGTGLAESIVSAAVSRNGHKVLHLDPRDYYGGKWTSLNWSSLESGTFAKEPVLESETQDTSASNSDFGFINPIRSLEQIWYCENAPSKIEEIRTLSRKFNVDVFPKVLLARDDIIELLISSNVSRYLEFKCISKIYSSLPAPAEDTIEPIPLSRSDIFTTKSLGLVEKRKLTKFIESVLKADETGGNDESSGEIRAEPMVAKTFEELARAASLTEKLQHLIKSAVKTVGDNFDPSRLNAEFVNRCRLFLQSIGRYGNQTPYLWTLYGVGEVCQAFCRLSAIYGGTYILKRSLNNLKVEGDELEVTFGETQLKTKYVVLGSEIKHTPTFQIGDTRTVVRAILLTIGGPIKSETQEGAESFMSVYKINDLEVVELDYTSLAVPKPYRLVQVTGPSVNQVSPRAFVESSLASFLDFSGTSPVEESKTVDGSDNKGDSNSENEASNLESPTDESANLRKESLSNGSIHMKPVVLYGTYFFIDFYENNKNVQGLSPERDSKIFYCATASTEITGEIRRAQEIFTSMYPEEEFLPKASDGSQAEDPEDETDVNRETANATNPADFNDNDGSASTPTI
ncbi:unnamed protein product [Allacma fusca]|uniref:Rab proteins geranylgeranyltransferase component A n=1 Tax=Allacma fusca TaxID=39272 RepID=A0A8J2J328_9HEXA|nr:unnamed protein product [Allacma fusca]